MAGKQRRGRMRPEEEQKIQTYSTKIIEEVEANDVVDTLFTAHVLDRDDVEDIRGGRMRKERSRRLLDLLSRRGPWAFDHFLRALEKKGYEGLVHLLKTPETVKSTGADKPSEPKATEGNQLKKIEDGWADLEFRLSRLVVVTEEGSKVEDKEFLEFQERFKAMKANSMEKLRSLAKDTEQKNDKIRHLEHDLDTARTQIQKLEKGALDTSAAVVEHSRRLEELERQQNSRLQKLEDDLAQQGQFFKNFREEMLRALEGQASTTRP